MPADNPGSELLASQYGGGLNTDRADGWHDARTNSNGHERAAHDRERRRVCGADAEEQFRQQAGEPECGEHAAHHSENRDTHPLPHDQPEDVTGAAAERHADTDVREVLLDVVAHHAVDADHGQYERNEREARDQQRERLRLLEGFRDELVHGPDL